MERPFLSIGCTLRKGASPPAKNGGLEARVTIIREDDMIEYDKGRRGDSIKSPVWGSGKRNKQNLRPKKLINRIKTGQTIRVDKMCASPVNSRTLWTGQFVINTDCPGSSSERNIDLLSMTPEQFLEARIDCRRLPVASQPVTLVSRLKHWLITYLNT